MYRNQPDLARIASCTLPMDLSLPWRTHDVPDPINNRHALWVRDALEVAYDQVRRHAGQAVRRQKRLYDKRAVKRVFAVGDWTGGIIPQTGLLTAFDWLWPVTQGGWGAAPPITTEGLADVN